MKRGAYGNIRPKAGFLENDVAYSNGNETFAEWLAANPDAAASTSEALQAYLNTKFEGLVTSATFTGAAGAGLFVESFKLEEQFDIKDGIFLSTGAMVGTTHGQGEPTVKNGAAGDADLNQSLIDGGFTGATTADAAAIEFTINVDSDNVTGFSLNAIFGTHETKFSTNSQYTDISAVYVNGVNYALFDGDADQPFTVSKSVYDDGYLIQNSSGSYAIDWGAFIEEAVFQAPLTQGENTIKIVVAEVNDGAYDSGLFVDGLTLITKEEQEEVTGGIQISQEVLQTFLDRAESKGFETPEQALEAYLNKQFDGSVSDVTYTGAEQAGYFVPDFSVDSESTSNTAFSVENALFFSTGGFVGSENTEEGYSVSHFTSGDSDLDASAQDAFSGAGATQDASVLTFNINVTDKTVDGMRFDLVFGSDEYPEFSDTSYTDIAAVYVNGVNVALFDDDDPSSALAITSSNQSKYGFFDNTTGDYDVEWDGFIKPLSIRAALEQGVNEIKIAIADTGDTIYASGMFVSNFSFLTGGGANAGILTSLTADEDTTDIAPTGIAEEIDISQASGPVSLTGGASDFDGDVISGFGAGDQLNFNGVTFTSENVEITQGSANFAIDSDQDGEMDTYFTLDGQFDLDTFEISSLEEGNGTAIGYSDGGKDKVKGTKGDDELYGFGGNDKIKGKGGDDYIEGGDGKDKIAGNAGNDIILGGAGKDKIKGGGGFDILNGGDGNDNLAGNGGVDLIFGGAGNDKLNGASGNDVLSGDQGDDLLKGGGGKDTFQFNLSNGGNDIIQDFTDKDQIEFLTVSTEGSFFVPSGNALLTYAAQDGNDVVFQFDAETSLTVLDYDIATLQDQFNLI